MNLKKTYSSINVLVINVVVVKHIKIQFIISYTKNAHHEQINEPPFCQIATIVIISNNNFYFETIYIFSEHQVKLLEIQVLETIRYWVH